MADYLTCYTPGTDVQVDTGKGHVAGVLLSSTSTTPGAFVLYDYAGASPPTGPAILMASVTAYSPVILLFNDRFAPRFSDGLWLHLSADCYLTLWHHLPKV